MKTTISASLIWLVGICMLTLAACSGPAAEVAGPMGPTNCPGVDTVLAQQQVGTCPR